MVIQREYNALFEKNELLRAQLAEKQNEVQNLSTENNRLQSVYTAVRKGMRSKGLSMPYEPDVKYPSLSDDEL